MLIFLGLRPLKCQALGVVSTQLMLVLPFPSPKSPTFSFYYVSYCYFFASEDFLNKLLMESHYAKHAKNGTLPAMVGVEGVA